MTNFTTILMVLALAIVFFALAMLGLGIGKLFNRKGISGGCCSTSDIRDADGERLTCGSCTCDDREAKHASGLCTHPALDHD